MFPSPNLPGLTAIAAFADDNPASVDSPDMTEPEQPPEPTGPTEPVQPADPDESTEDVAAPSPISGKEGTIPALSEDSPQVPAIPAGETPPPLTQALTPPVVDDKELVYDMLSLTNATDSPLHIADIIPDNQTLPDGNIFIPQAPFPDYFSRQNNILMPGQTVTMLVTAHKKATLHYQITAADNHNHSCQFQATLNYVRVNPDDDDPRPYIIHSGQGDDGQTPSCQFSSASQPSDPPHSKIYNTSAVIADPVIGSINSAGNSTVDEPQAETEAAD